VNSVTAASQRWPSAASDAHGNFVVAWSRDYDPQVSVRRFAPDGTPFGGDVVAHGNSFVASESDLAASPDGGFVLV
jgi:hypothetical protein